MSPQQVEETWTFYGRAQELEALGRGGSSSSG
jgi:hypothetical protein